MISIRMISWHFVRSRDVSSELTKLRFQDDSFSMIEGSDGSFSDVFSMSRLVSRQKWCFQSHELLGAQWMKISRAIEEERETTFTQID